jgi:ElaB/YqjD/DUF883 family membrane-anchored ribosome-binding protein
MNQLAFAAVLVSLLASGGFALALQSREGTPSQPAAPTVESADVRQLVQQVQTLERQVAALTRELAKEAPAAAPALAEPTQEELQEADAAAAAARQAHMQVVEQSFRAEPHTADGVGAESDLQDRLEADEHLRDAVRAVSCRAATCRVELASDAGALAEGLPLFIHRQAEAFPKVIANETAFGDGTRHLVLYLSRAPAGEEN